MRPVKPSNDQAFPDLKETVLTAPVSIAWREIMLVPEFVSAGHRATSCLFKLGWVEFGDFEHDDASANDANMKQGTGRKVILRGYRSPGSRTSGVKVLAWQCQETSGFRARSPFQRIAPPLDMSYA